MPDLPQPTFAALRSIRPEPGEPLTAATFREGACFKGPTFIRRYDTALADRLEAIVGKRKIHLISVSAGPHKRWARLWAFLRPGDIVCFTGGEGVFAVADVLLTGRSVPLSRGLEWDSEYGPYEFFLEGARQPPAPACWAVYT